ncbi:hypothetical protein E2C01_051062 [Portunus trituberculatus]|uniref:Uncharacterized protein n=1 Tax=Portunus trituberculatus TaxID=210409 RepID=A0A5B7GHQ3_PORTR|nr:hypothetical protein [Portunus trituberculatus]
MHQLTAVIESKTVRPCGFSRPLKLLMLRITLCNREFVKMS